ncbi:MAG: hypothetical protein RIB67_05910 [Miltoncostaeaceae bacterium]
MTTTTDLDIHRIGAKLFAVNPEVIDADAYIGIFHTWIQAQDLDGTPIDVADYKHVPDGPGIMLISHEADRSVDFADGRPGAIYQRKRDLSGPLEERFAQVVLAADATAERIEGEGRAAGVRFDRDQMEIRLHDRRLVPNSDQGLAAVRPALETALARVREGKTAHIERAEDDPRAPLTLRVTLT